MNLVLQKLAALALGSTLAGGILAGFAWWREVDATQVDPNRVLKQRAVEQELPAARQARQAILDSLLSTNTPDWAGDYVNSGGYETCRLTVGPEGFSYEYSHCTGTGELAYGEVESVEGSRVLLRPTFHERPDKPRERAPSERSDFWFEPDLFVVRWNNEQFLVPASKMTEFCRLAKAVKWEAMRYASYPRLRSGERRRSNFWDSHFEGLPDVPAEFRHLLPAE